MRVACVQMCSGREVAANLAAAETLIRQAAAEGARLIATPEGTGFMDRAPGALRQKAVAEEDDAVLAGMRSLASELGCHLLIGSLAVRAGTGRAANRSFLLAPDGTISARYDKIHMFDVTLSAGERYRESDGYAAGDRMVLASAGPARIGMSICYDLRFARLYRELAQAGANLLAVPSAFTRTTGQAHWHVLLRARAIETGSFVMAPAQGGCHEDGRETFGHSLIIGPWGEILAEKADDTPGLILADLDWGMVASARARVPAWSLNRSWT